MLLQNFAVGVPALRLLNGRAFPLPKCFEDSPLQARSTTDCMRSPECRQAKVSAIAHDHYPCRSHREIR
jgi:hypothetical protein